VIKRLFKPKEGNDLPPMLSPSEVEDLWTKSAAEQIAQEDDERMLGVLLDLTDEEVIKMLKDIEDDRTPDPDEDLFDFTGEYDLGGDD
jgi:hypothetical protein